MPSTETVGTRRTRKIAEEAGKQAARETFMEMSIGDEVPHDNEELESIANSTEAVNKKRDLAFDLFDDVGRPMAEQNVTVHYIIHKNNELAGSKRHPYSWIALAKDFGPGSYQVFAKDENKKYISSQRQTISEDAEIFRQKEGPTERASEPQQVSWQQPQMSFVEMLNLMQGQSDRAKSEANLQAQQQAQTQVAMVTMMTEMMKSAQMQSQQIFMEMTKMTAAVTEKIATSQEKMFEKVNQRVDKIAELATKKPDGPGWLEIMKMNNESQNKGFELFEKITKLADIKKEEQLELIEEAKSLAGGSGETKPKSMTDSLIESLLPVITASMLQNQQATQLALAQTQARKNGPPQLPQQRRSIRPPRASQPSPSNGGVQPQQRATQTRTTTPVEAKKETEVRASGTSRERDGQGVGQVFVTPRSHSIQLVDSNMQEKSPVLEFNNIVEPEAAQVQRSVADKVEVVASSTNEQVKERCMDMLPTFLGTLMLDSVPAPEAAKRTVEFLESELISREQFLESVKSEVLLGFAKQFDLPKEAHDWLNDLYAHIQDESRNDVRRESSASLEHETPIGS